MCEVELKTIEPVQDSWSSRPVLDTIPPHLKMLFAGIVCNPPLMSRPVARKEGLRQRAHSTHRPTDSWLAQPGRARGRGGERNDRRWNCMEDSPHSSRNTDIETPEVRWIALIAFERTAARSCYIMVLWTRRHFSIRVFCWTNSSRDRL